MKLLNAQLIKTHIAFMIDDDNSYESFSCGYRSALRDLLDFIIMLENEADYETDSN